MDKDELKKGLFEENLKNLILKLSSPNVKGLGPVPNADVYEAMIKNPLDLIDAQNTNENTSWWYGSPRNPKIETSKGNLSPRDINIITRFGITSDQTDKLTSKPWSNGDWWAWLDAYSLLDRNAEYGSAGPVLDALVYRAIKERADNAARKDRLYKDLVKGGSNFEFVDE